MQMLSTINPKEDLPTINNKNKYIDLIFFLFIFYYVLNE